MISCARFGGVDIVIGNAGVSAGTLTEKSEDRQVFQEILDINVVGLFNTFQPFLLRYACRARRNAGGHRQCRWISGSAWSRRLLRLQGRGDDLSGKPSVGVAWQRRTTWSRFVRAMSLRR